MLLPTSKVAFKKLVHTPNSEGGFSGFCLYPTTHFSFSSLIALRTVQKCVLWPAVAAMNAVNWARKGAGVSEDTR